MSDEKALATLDQAPSYLAQYSDGSGAEELSGVQTTPRLTVVQSMTDRDLKEAFGEGAVVMMPDAELVAEPGEAFSAVPVLFWQTWEKWYDVNDRTAQHPVAESTMDPTSDLAAKAKGRITEYYPDNPKMWFTYQERLNFILALLGGGGVLRGQCVCSWSKGGFRFGAGVVRHIRDAIKARSLPIYAVTLSLKSKEHVNKKQQQYWVLDAAKSETCWTSEGLLEGLRDMHNAAKSARDAGRFAVETAEGGEDHGDE